MTTFVLLTWIERWWARLLKFVVVDITEYPHQVVAKYRNNEIKPMLFPSIIFDAVKAYNNAWVLCEVNDIGDQIGSIFKL